MFRSGMEPTRPMRKHVLVTASIGVILFSWPTFTLAQWSIVGTPPWTSTSIQTTGGITYFLHSATLRACNAVDTTPVARSGTNLSITVAQMAWSGPCGYCYDCYHTQTTATVLGELPAGAYRLFIYSYPFYDPLEPPPSPSLWQIRDFQAGDQTGATLEFIKDTNAVRVCLRGVPAATYVLESSTNLVQWTSVRTNVGGPCTFTNSVGVGEVRFFRTRILSGAINAP